jgi:hypothetical protein
MEMTIQGEWSTVSAFISKGIPMRVQLSSLALWNKL